MLPILQIKKQSNLPGFPLLANMRSQAPSCKTWCCQGGVWQEMRQRDTP